MPTPKKKSFARPRWDDMDNFTKKLEERRNMKLEEHGQLVIKLAELRMQFAQEQKNRTWVEDRTALLLEEARCERDVATEKYVELSKWVDSQRKKKKGLRGPRP